MSGYDYNSIVSRSETEALKEMIFKRARERAELLNKDTQNQYTTSMQKEVMEIARDSFVASKNPFSIIAEPKKEEVAVQEKAEEKSNIGFAQKNTEKVKTQIETKLKTVKEDIANNEVTANMLEARTAFENKKSFMGALNFLNSQASISLINSKSKKFEAFA